MRRGAALGFVLMLNACAAVPAEEEQVPVMGGSGGTCNAGPAQALVGRPATSELGAEALRLSGSQALRWIPPGGMVTMDYREDRLNIELDAQNRVVRLRCG